MKRELVLVAVGFGLSAFMLLPVASTAWAGEGRPEVVDARGDVTYNEAYPGQRDHDYLDILKAWWGYDSSADEISLTLQGLDYSTFSDPPPADFTISCLASTTLSKASSPTGRLTFGFQNPYDASEFTPSVSFSKSGQAGTGGPIPLAFEFKGAFGTPGHLEFAVSRHLLLSHGDLARDLSVRCGEQYFPGQYPSNNVAPSFPVVNSDEAEGNGSLNFIALTPTGQMDTDPDPFGSPVEDQTVPSSSPARSPGFAMVGCLLAAVLVPWWYRRTF